MNISDCQRYLHQNRTSKDNESNPWKDVDVNIQSYSVFKKFYFATKLEITTFGSAINLERNFASQFAVQLEKHVQGSKVSTVIFFNDTFITIKNPLSIQVEFAITKNYKKMIRRHRTNRSRHQFMAIFGTIALLSTHFTIF